MDSRNLPKSHMTSITIYSSPPKTQNFSLPENIIFYLSKNPSTTKVYEKLIETCKYFYLKAQIITFYGLYSTLSENVWSSRKLNDMEFYGSKMKNLPNKIWINDSLNVGRICKISDIFPNLYRCDITNLFLSNQRLTISEFNYLISCNTLESLDFHKTIVKDNGNGSIVPIEKLIEKCCNLQEFIYGHDFEGDGRHSITRNSIKNIFNIPHFLNLNNFFIRNVPEIFDFEEFLNSFKEPIKMDIFFKYPDNISARYSERLKNYVDNIIAKGLTENFPPDFNYPGMTYEAIEALRKLREAHEERYKQ